MAAAYRRGLVQVIRIERAGGMFTDRTGCVVILGSNIRISDILQSLCGQSADGRYLDWSEWRIRLVY